MDAVSGFTLDLELVILFVTGVLLFCFLTLTKRRKNLPPGPFPTLPLIGNILQMPCKDPLLSFQELRARYGDAFTVTIGNELMVVLNGYETIREALVKKGRVFSHRPLNYWSQHVQHNKGLALVSGEFWHEQRQFTTHILNSKSFAKENLEKKIVLEIQEFLAFLETKVGSSLDINGYLKMFALNAICNILSSTRYDYNDPKPKRYLDALEEGLRIIGSLGPLSFALPLMKYLPGDVFKVKAADRNLEKRWEFLFEIYAQHLNTLKDDSLRDFVDHYIVEILKRKSEGSSNFTLEQFIFLFQDLIGAGTDTTSASVGWLIWYSIKHPHVQKRLQSDILNVIGSDRLPTLEDQSKLPYVEATIMEVLRMSHLVPFAVPHAASENTQFRGFDIPKGTTVIVNLHSVMMDPSIWENPNEFRPERFVDKDGLLLKPKEYIPFSIGKRVCFGETMAGPNLFLLACALFQRFSFVDPDRQTNDKNDGILGLTFNPKPYNVTIIYGQLPH